MYSIIMASNIVLDFETAGFYAITLPETNEEQHFRLKVNTETEHLH